jgi:hypothetical protein
LVAKAAADLPGALVVNNGHSGNRVGDLFTHWEHLAPVLTTPVLRRLLGQLHVLPPQDR